MISFLILLTILSHEIVFVVKVNIFSLEKSVKMFPVINFVLSSISDKTGEVYLTSSRDNLLFKDKMSLKIIIFISIKIYQIKFKKLIKNLI